MVYQKDSKFVAVITCKGKILRDFKNDEDNYQVKMPFGSEYGIRLKNLNTTRVAFTVYIDGEDVLDGSRIILDPNESHDLEGFMKNSSVKNKFKFIEKTKKISEHRGDNIDDGMIRIEYQFEKKPAVIEKTPVINTYRPLREEMWNGGVLRFYNVTYDARRINLSNVQSTNDSFSLEDTVNEQGITVKGSQTNINYKTGWLGEMEEVKHVIVLTLSGYKETDKKKVTQAVTVKQKIECETCGTKNKSSNKFCSDCGTCLL